MATELPEFSDLTDAPRDGSVIEVRHGPDQVIVLARWFAQTQAFVCDGDPYRRTLHRVTGWRPATEEQTASANERRKSVQEVVKQPSEETAPQEAIPVKTAIRIVKARKPRPRR